MTEKFYSLRDDQAAELWRDVIANFVGAEHWSGSASLRAFILAPIANRTSAVVHRESAELQSFLSQLDSAFRRGQDLLDRKSYKELIELWSPIGSSALFDSKHPVWKDKPYYRCQIGGGICQLFVAHANCMDVNDLDKWLERVLMYVARMIELDPIDPSQPGYFHGNTEAASAQNHNLAMVLDAAANWMMRGWSADTIATLSSISKSDAHNIEHALRERAREFSIYL
jgi:hypothetical protein